MTYTITPKKLRDRYTDDSFKDVEELEKFLIDGNKLKYDFVIVGKILFTMHEYDEEGKYITFANRKNELMLEIETSNRYKNGFIDARVSQYQPYGLRVDISYAE